MGGIKLQVYDKKGNRKQYNDDTTDKKQGRLVGQYNEDGELKFKLKNNRIILIWRLIY
jgi:hypothetical protein